MKKGNQKTQVQISRLGFSFWGDLGHWLRFVWPAVLVVGCGWLFFAEAIEATIVSTPHPALVYAIFGTCAIAIASSFWSVKGYLHEAALSRGLLKLPIQERQAIWANGEFTSKFAPVYDILFKKTLLSKQVKQTAITSELEAGELALESLLEFPNFLGGALVGLGLVGTFVGLLGTLEDLSKVFSALTNSGSTDMSPTEMFADMVSKLQAPMRGMGTAFVASLYGLLGSLIITLMLVAARKTNAYMNQSIHMVVRQLAYGAANEVAGSEQTDVNTESSEMLVVLTVWADEIKKLKFEFQNLQKQILKQNEAHDSIARANVELNKEILFSTQKVIKTGEQSRLESLADRKAFSNQLLEVISTLSANQLDLQNQNKLTLAELLSATKQVVQMQSRSDEELGSALGALRVVLRQISENNTQMSEQSNQELAKFYRGLQTCERVFENSTRALQDLTKNISFVSVQKNK